MGRENRGLADVSPESSGTLPRGESRRQQLLPRPTATALAADSTPFRGLYSFPLDRALVSMTRSLNKRNVMIERGVPRPSEWELTLGDCG